MAQKTFVFCDICNFEAIRILENRRHCVRENDIDRRHNDGRHWFEGSLFQAQAEGWVEDSKGRHICQRCHEFLLMDRRQKLG